ncbi:radical SAM protein [Streptomyces ginkgonis]|uniref:radical SAM protein n=1 Tax=Streptomyces ginkgonis TaxID=1812259 RepID=UPI002176E687|nr:radical SAM protein [Streptomyces ginkgonis]
MDLPRDGLPRTVLPDRTLRVKILDHCGLACTFCHNEGTPVAADSPDRPGVVTSGRVSIYAHTNGVTFQPARIEPGPDFALALAAVRGTVATDEAHFTGGEPTLHPRLPALIADARRVGLTVGLTSNGENGAAVLPACAEAGLDRVNFSIFGTTARELAAVQGGKYRSAKLAERKLRALDESIRTAASCGIGVSANIVVPGRDHVARVLRLVARHGSTATIRLLTSLADGQRTSLDAIALVLKELDAQPEEHILTAGASDWRTRYRLPDGSPLYVKRIRPVRLPQTCRSCRFNNDTDCEEGYYGIRLYRARSGPFMVGVCIRRMDLTLPLGEFVMSQVGREISGLREDETAGRLSVDPG